MNEISATVIEKDGGSVVVRCAIEEVLLAGYTGRDRAGVLEHIHELEALGIAPPSRVPMVYVVGADLITSESRIAAVSPDTSGEAEFYFLPTSDGLLVGVGSDHTDRKQEAIDIAASKRLCPKVVSRDVWRYANLEDHWDRIEIRSWMTNAEGHRLYQDGHLGAFLAPGDLLDELRRAGHDRLDGRLIFGGTLPVIGGLICGSHFEAELRDPVLGRSLSISYDVVKPE